MSIRARRSFRPLETRGRWSVLAVLVVFMLVSVLTLGISIRATSHSQNQAAVVELAGRQRTLAERYPASYGAWGFYDAVDPKSGQVALSYLPLDQGMLLVAIANYLADHVIQRAFAADPVAARALPILADERFFD